MKSKTIIPFKFYIGEKVNITSNKYAGCNAIVRDQHPNHNPNLYTVQEIQSGKLLCYYEHELQSMYQHDMNQLKLRSDNK